MSFKYCHLCGELISGGGKRIRHAAWQKDRGLRVCQGCYHEKPHCCKCGIPLAEKTTNGFCVTCTALDKRCLICGNRIKGRFWNINGQGPYCDSCRQEQPPCDLCRAPMSSDQWTLADGRVICQHCRETGIFHKEQASVLYEESKDVIAKTLGLQLNIPTALVLVDRQQLTEVIRKQSNGSQPLDIQNTMGIYARRGIKRAIYVQTGLPRRLFIQVASHEIAHAWQGENCPLLSDDRFREGFAEWVAYRVLSHYGYEDQMHQMQNGDNLYSQGLQWMLAMESEVGVRGILETCRKSR